MVKGLLVDDFFLKDDQITIAFPVELSISLKGLLTPFVVFPGSRL